MEKLFADVSYGNERLKGSSDDTQIGLGVLSVRNGSVVGASGRKTPPEIWGVLAREAVLECPGAESLAPFRRHLFVGDVASGCSLGLSVASSAQSLLAGPLHPRRGHFHPRRTENDKKRNNKKGGGHAVPLGTAPKVFLVLFSAEVMHRRSSAHAGGGVLGVGGQVLGPILGSTRRRPRCGVALLCGAVWLLLGLSMMRERAVHRRLADILHELCPLADILLDFVIGMRIRVVRAASPPRCVQSAKHGSADTPAMVSRGGQILPPPFDGRPDHRRQRRALLDSADQIQGPGLHARLEALFERESLGDQLPYTGLRVQGHCALLVLLVNPVASITTTLSRQQPRKHQDETCLLF